MSTYPPPPDRRFVQTPPIIAARLGVFGLMLLLAVRGLFSRRWRAPAAGCLGLTCTCLRLADQFSLAYSSPSQLFVNR